MSTTDPTVIRGLRINYYAEDKRRLIHDCLVPLAKEAHDAPGIASAWLQSNWRFGPHTMLYLHGAPAAVDALLPQLQARAEAHLATDRSTRVITDEEWERTSYDLGRLELVSPPYLPLEPDNTVSIQDGGPSDTFLRTERALHAKGRTIGSGLDCLHDASGRLFDGPDATNAVFRGMAALAVNYPRWGLISGYQAFLSHWKEYFYWTDTDGRLSRPLERSWAAQRDGLVAVVQRAKQRQPGESTGDPVLDRWIAWVEERMPDALALAATEDILPYPHPSRLEKAETFGPDLAVQWSGSDERDYSDFHAAFRQLDFTKLGNGTDFAAYRFLINSFFELLPLVGVTPMQRYSLAYLFTEAAQDVVGERWDTTIARTVERQRAAEPELRPTLPWAGSHV